MTPVEALTEALGEGVTVVHERGCDNRHNVPVLGGAATAAPGHDRPELAVDWFANPDLAGEPVHHSHTPSADLVAFEPPVPGLAPGGWSLRAHTVVTPTESGPHEVTLTQAGRARVLVEGVTVLDGFTDPPPGLGVLRHGQRRGRRHRRPGGQPARGRDRRVHHPGGPRGRRPAHRLAGPRAADLMERAVAAAAAAEVAVVVVGTTGEWESEGLDRTTMDLPGHGTSSCAGSSTPTRPRSVVVNAGAPVTMDWAPEAGRCCRCGSAARRWPAGAADVLLGEAEPAGRLPTTLPVLLEHNPSYGNFPGEAGRPLRRGDPGRPLVPGRKRGAVPLRPRRVYDLVVGRGVAVVGGHASGNAAGGAGPGHQHRRAAGRRGGPVLRGAAARRRGPRAPGAGAFAKVWVEPGETMIELVLDDRAFACWAPARAGRDEVAARASHVPQPARPAAGGPGWRIDPGRYELHLGRSATEIHRVLAVEVATVPA